MCLAEELLFKIPIQLESRSSNGTVMVTVAMLCEPGLILEAVMYSNRRGEIKKKEKNDLKLRGKRSWAMHSLIGPFLLRFSRGQPRPLPLSGTQAMHLS